jgi:hypothetical protein
MFKFFKNPMFWIGVQVMNLLYIITSFIEGDNNWKYTLVLGVILILLTGLDFMQLEKDKKREDA